MAPTFNDLPAEIVEHIAYFSALLHPHSPPSSLHSLLLLHRATHALLRPDHNAGLYAKLFKQRFDAAAPMRRFAGPPAVGYAGPADPAASAGTRFVTSQRPASASAAAAGAPPPAAKAGPLKSPRHEGSLVLSGSSASQSFAAANFPALAPASAAPASASARASPVPAQGLSPRHLADAFLSRLALLRRLRRAAASGSLESLGLPAPGGVARTTGPVPAAVLYSEAHMTQLTKDLWEAYLMVLEDDGRNVEQLVEFGDIKRILTMYYKQEMKEAAVLPGYPQDTPDRCLAMHLFHMLLDEETMVREGLEDSGEQFFVLKPYVFAAHVFDAYYAPWTIRSLPVSRSPSTPRATDSTSATEASLQPSKASTDDGSEQGPFADRPGFPADAYSPTPSQASDEGDLASIESAFLADLKPKVRKQVINYFGRRLEIVPPILSHAACRSFFARVEQDPEDAPRQAVGIAPGETPPAHSASDTMRILRSTLGLGPAPTSASGAMGGFDPAQEPLTSAAHDKDFLRLTACLDPYSSPGLHPLLHLSDFAGAWEGRFSFFDFDSYREMLSGDVLRLYDGPFGDQPQVWKLEEKVRRLRDGRVVRGAGRAMGRAVDEGKGVKEALARAAREEAEELVMAVAGGRSSASGGGAGGGPKDKGKGRYQEPLEKEEDEEELDDDEDYEIELQGTGHSAWGQFILQGRVRAWDGMFTLTKEYTPDGRGRWLYRGYATAGGMLVGRWRDTFTPEHLSGYEGTFLMRRRV